MTRENTFATAAAAAADVAVVDVAATLQQLNFNEQLFGLDTRNSFRIGDRFLSGGGQLFNEVSFIRLRLTSLSKKKMFLKLINISMHKDFQNSMQGRA